MKKLSLTELAEIVILDENRPLSPTEIWELVISKGYSNNVDLKGENPVMAIGAALRLDFRSKKDRSTFYTLPSNSEKFFVRHLNQKNGKNKTNGKKVSDYGIGNETLEKDLHKNLAHFCKNHFNAHLETISHSRSIKNSKFLKWNHPDMVGFYSPFDKWSNQLAKLSTITKDPFITLFSFEIKRSLKPTNLRESFFQTVSNSSWANKGFLVAGEITIDDDEFLSELKRLSIAFGIGIIKLEIINPDTSRILFPAKFREHLDWETINKLAEANLDFAKFLESIIEKYG